MFDLSFDKPVILSFLFLLPFIIWYLEKQRTKGGVIPFSYAVWKDRGYEKWDRTMRRLILLGQFFFWSGVVFLVIAAAAPSAISRKKVYLSSGAEIIIVLDESPSMSAKDFQPENRFEAAKEIIKNFISGRENDRIGLVAFSREAALIVPPTAEYDALYSKLDSLQIMELGNGTSIGNGIAVAINHLKQSKSAPRVIILLTDGDNNSGEILPETAADIAMQLGIKIYTIGIGKNEDTYIEFRDPKTGKLYQGMYRGRLGVALLKRIAKRSGGRYFYAPDEESLREIFERIDSEEKVVRLTSFKTVKENKSKTFILLGMLLILLDFAMRKILLKEILG